VGGSMALRGMIQKGRQTGERTHDEVLFRRGDIGLADVGELLEEPVHALENPLHRLHVKLARHGTGQARKGIRDRARLTNPCRATLTIFTSAAAAKEPAIIVAGGEAWSSPRGASCVLTLPPRR
jgi:hypothetical protein